MKHKITSLLLGLILILSFFLRFYKLGTIPPGPEWDEASVGYNAYSISQTGKDEWGNKLPLIFPAFGDFKNPLYIYLTAGVVKIFGLNITTTRFVNAFSGSLFILVIFGVSQFVFRNYIISLLSALFLAVSPFGIFFSRIAGDGIMLSVFLIGTGLFFELYFIQKNKNWAFFISILLLAFSVFSYNLGRIIAPLMILAILSVNFIILKKSEAPRTYTHSIFTFRFPWSKTLYRMPFISRLYTTMAFWYMGKKVLLIPLLFCLLIFAIIFQQSKLNFNARMKYIGIFEKDKGVILQINKYRDQDKNSLLSKIMHNKITFFAVTIGSNYLSHFSSDFLGNFNNTNLVSESHQPPLYLISIPFYYIGLILLFVKFIREKNTKTRWSLFLILSLIFLSPIPSTITEGAPSGKRNLASLGTMEMTVSLGLFYFLQSIKENSNKLKYIIALSVLSILFVLSVFLFLKFFFITYPAKYDFIYAKKERSICSFLNKNYSVYDRIIFSKRISGVPYIFPLFCLRYDPRLLEKTRNYNKIESWFYVYGFGKFIFPDESTNEIIENTASSKNKIALFVNEDEKNSLYPLLSKFIPAKKLERQSEPLIYDKNNRLYLFTIDTP